MQQQQQQYLKLAACLSPPGPVKAGPKGAVTSSQQVLLPFLTQPADSRLYSTEVADAGSGLLLSPFCTIVSKKESCVCEHLKCAEKQR